MFKRAVDFFMKSEHLCIIAHADPDADAIGSTVALALGLRAAGRRVTVHNIDGVPDGLRFLPDSDCVQQDIPSDVDAMVLVDVASTDRAGELAAELSQRVPMYIVDHHQLKGLDYSKYTIDPDVAASAVLVYGILKELNVEITAAMATNLYTAVVGDTGGFRYEGTTPAVFQMAADLVACGARPDQIATATQDQQHPAMPLLLGRSLETLEYLYDGKVACMLMSQDMLRATGAEVEHAETFVYYPRSVAGIEVSTFIRELPDGRWKVSMRSKEHVDVSAIARDFGGGGHVKAAGCVFDSLGQARSELLPAIARAVEASASTSNTIDSIN